MADSAERQLAQFIRKYSPAIASLAREVLARMQARLPGAHRLVYDNYNALAIGFGPTERTSDVIFSIAVFPRWVSLFFFNGAQLKDPDGLLKGTGRQARHIVLESARTLDRVEVRALMRHALEEGGTRFGRRAEARLIVKSVSPKQRPRRPTPSKASR